MSGKVAVVLFGRRQQVWTMIAESTQLFVPNRLLALITIALVCGLLTAGLLPFRAPRNAVAWSEDRNGLRFGEYGTVLSAGPLETVSSQDRGRSLEIWLQPGRIDDASTILALCTPEELLRFSLRQQLRDLVLETQSRVAGHRRVARMYVDDVFRENEPVFLTVASGPSGVQVYRDGALVKTAAPVRLRAGDLAGRLVLGTSSVQSDNWSGQLRGLAIYDGELSASQVRLHCQSWTQKGQPEIAESERPVAVYVFDEHAGNIAHNRVKGGVDLIIPDRYLILDQLFLQPPWEEFEPTWSYCKDIAINIGGFVPLGVFLCAYLSLGQGIRRAALVTTLAGAVISCTIEVLQAYLPTRHSGMTDILTNTLGTGVGVACWIGVGPVLGRVASSPTWLNSLWGSGRRTRIEWRGSQVVRQRPRKA